MLPWLASHCSDTLLGEVGTLSCQNSKQVPMFGDVTTKGVPELGAMILVVKNRSSLLTTAIKGC